MVQPLSDAINKIAEQMRSVRPVLQIGEEYNYNWPGLEKFNQPYPGGSYEDFINNFVKNYALYKNFFLVMVGAVNVPPVWFYIVEVGRVTVQFDTKGIPTSFTVTNGESQYSSQTITYKRTYDANGNMRFFDETQTEEIVPFSMDAILRQKNLVTAFRPLALACLQYLHANMHHLNLMQNGVSAKMILSVPEAIPEKKKAEIKNEIDSAFTGVANVGKIVLLSRMSMGEAALTPVPEQSNKDLEFKALKDDARDTIYYHIGVQKQFVNPDTSTYNNLSMAKVGFFEHTIIPQLEYLYSFLSRVLLPRYNITNGKITYNPKNNPAIMAAKMNQATQLAQIPMAQNFTMAEIRRLVGYEDDMTEDRNPIAPADDEDQATADQAMQQARQRIEGATEGA